MRDLILSLLCSLLITEIIECAFACLLKKRGKTLVLVGLVNLITNPVVVLLHFLFGGSWIITVLLEAAAIAAEGGFYHYSMLFNRPFSFSLAANILSFFVGFLITRII